MKPKNPEPALLPNDLPIAALLGLREPKHGDWSRLRGIQFAGLAKASAPILGCQILAGLATAHIMHPVIGLAPLILWLVVLAGLLFSGFQRDLGFADTDRREFASAEVTSHRWQSAALAALWAIPAAYSAFQGTPAISLELWAIITMLIAATSVLAPAIPLGTFMLCLVTGIATSASLVYAGMIDAGIAAAVTSGLVAFGAIRTARNFLISHVAESAMLEKSEVVSLLLREFEEGEADWLWHIDTARRVRSISPRFAFALGLDPDEIEGKPFVQLIAGEAWETGQFPPSLHELAERLKQRESFSNQLVRVTIRGTQRWWELSGTPKMDDFGNYDGFRGVGSDVTDQRESAEQIANLARYDTLTSLPNRLMLTESMGDAMRFAEQWRTKCAFLMIDLDRFKAVNDSLGHIVGDQLLARVAARLRELMTENELCGRLGGDEFAIVIRDASDMQRVEHVARQVIERLSQPYEVDHHTLYVGASVGSAVGPRDGSTVETLMRNADLALYRAKDAGRGTHCSYEPTLHAHAEERRKLEFSLRRALERDELKLHYQPVVDSGSEAVVSFEALLRWESPEHGMVSPAKFIPLAEDTRLIIPIGEWVLKTACREATKWPSHVKVAVNVSGEQLLDQHFASTVVAALAISGLPANRLELEVTESIFLRDATTARATLEQCMALGCGIALDDFGTGYSSLGYIRKLRFSTIKVDRSFVQGAATGNRESLAIIRAVVAMAQSLDMTTTAEGVETAAELALVRSLGATKIQGFFFGRPMAPEEALKLFHQNMVRRTGEAA